MKILLRFAFGLAALASTALVGLALAVIGAYYYVAPSLPDPETLREVQLQVPMRVYSRDGLLLAEFGEQRRIPLLLEDIPPKLRWAFLPPRTIASSSIPAWTGRGWRARPWPSR